MALFDRALTVFAHARPDDAQDVIKILCTMATVADLTYPLHGPRTADLNGRRADWGHDERKADDGLRTARMVPVPPAG